MAGRSPEILRHLRTIAGHLVLDGREAELLQQPGRRQHEFHECLSGRRMARGPGNRDGEDDRSALDLIAGWQLVGGFRIGLCEPRVTQIDLRGKRDVRQVVSDDLVLVKDPGVELTGLDAGEQHDFGEHLVGVHRFTQHAGNLGLLIVLSCKLEHEQRPVPLRIGRRITAAEPQAGQLEHLVPGSRVGRRVPQLLGERALWIVRDHELRRRHRHEPRHEVIILVAHQHGLVDRRIGADEYIRTPQMIVDHPRATQRALGFALVAVSGRFRERGAQTVLHRRGKRAGVQHRDRVVPGALLACGQDHRSTAERNPQRPMTDHRTSSRH
jgi:hypothetical protein